MNDFLGSEKSEVIRMAADAAIKSVIKHWLAGDQRNKGGYCRVFVLTAFDYRELVPLCEFWLGGTANRNKKTKYEICSFEKALRLALRSNEGHVSSFQSAIHDLLYAGAILFRCSVPECGPDPVFVILSFSGLPEMADEAAMLAVAEKMDEFGWKPNRDDLLKVLKASNNNVYQGPLIDEM